jgi:hypothetical protein
MSRIPALLGISALTGYMALQVLGRRAGSTAAERAAILPGDDLVADPQMVTNHAITIEASAERIWPWISQMGWRLGGYYTPGWVDRFLFPNNWSSLDALDPRLVRDLKVGDIIPDGPPGTAEYVVAEVEPPNLLVLRSTSHIPPGWDAYGVAIIWTWCWRLTPLGGDRTRVQLRVRGRMSPWWFAALYLATIIPSDYIMSVGMLRGLKLRAEANGPPEVSGREPISDGSTWTT